MTSPAMLTDRYELSMLQSFIADGTVDKRATFEVFARKLQPGFRYGVFAGLGRLLPMIENFRFEGSDLTWLRENDIVNRDTYLYLSDFEFTGTIESYAEGDLYFPNSPVLTVSGTLGECILLETLILSVLNWDSAIATKAARMVSVAKGRPIIEMGSRRTHEESALAAARAAYIAGFASTSNLAAGMVHGVPTSGTAAHAFTLAHDTEPAAFAAQIAAHGPETSLLVDTYDIAEGIHNAVVAAQQAGAKGPGAIRLDSGDLAAEAHKARKQLDAAGAHDTKIIVTGDLDEYVMKDLASAPIDGYGVGTKLVSVPPAGFVYKLVEIESLHANSVSGGTYMRPVAKKAKDKVSVGGKKFAYRVFKNSTGCIAAERYRTDRPPLVNVEPWRVLQYPVMVDGEIADHLDLDLDQIREDHARAFAELPESEQTVWSGTEFGPFLEAVKV